LNIKSAESAFTNTETTVSESAIENMCILKDVSNYETMLKPVISAIQNKQYESVKNHFTEDGYKIFQKLIEYGNAQVLEYDSIKGLSNGKQVMIREIPMIFSFKANKKQFIENVIFYFDNNDKICDLSFSLSKTALNDIWNKDKWAEEDRIIIVNFLEHYKTAYALKRINYIKSIFSDDALIIVGNYETNIDPENPYKNNKILNYNQYTKQEYINRLNTLFQNKEYVNLQFEQCDIRTGGKKHIYGIQIKQNYYSSNYGDQGYLFLLVDLQDTSKPTIHVRTWQAEPDKKGNIFGLQDF
jgi:hypothetical protein